MGGGGGGGEGRVVLTYPGESGAYIPRGEWCLHTQGRVVLTYPFGQHPLPKKLIITCKNNRIQNCHLGNNNVTVDSIII